MASAADLPVPVGTTVMYVLTEADAARIQGNHNPGREGDEYPAVVVRRWQGTTVNLHVLVDGNQGLWCTSRTEGTGPGTYHRL